MNKVIITSILFLFLSTLTACASKSKEQVFLSSMRAYERVLRWDDITKTNIFRLQPIPFTAEDRKKLKAIKVTGYEILQTKQNDELNATVTVQISYYYEQTMRAKTVEDVQTWNYNEDKQVWYISSPLPKF